MILTVFTPTYNRADFLPIIYQSLLNQTVSDFEWLIIDDGSTDNTCEVVENLKVKNPPFKMNYIYKGNGGKHTAINRASVEAEGEFILWLDSDDRIITNSIEDFIKKLREVKDNREISAVVGLRLSEKHKPLGSYVPENDEDVDFLRFILKNKVRGDYSWAIKKEVLKEFPFPVYEGERFCTEGVILNRISEKYKTRFINLPVIIGEYIPGGLTDNMKRLTSENPFGFLTYYKEIIESPRVALLHKIKYGILYWTQRKRCKKAVPKTLKANFLLNLMKLPTLLLIKIYHFVKPYTDHS